MCTYFSICMYVYMRVYIYIYISCIIIYLFVDVGHFRKSLAASALRSLAPNVGL